MTRGSRKIVYGIAILLIIGVVLTVVSADQGMVERIYTQGLYPRISWFQRTLLGRIPFSVGDFLYILFFAWIFYKVIQVVVFLFKRKLSFRQLGRKAVKLVLLLLLIYDFFMLVWGMNYSRQGIRQQLNMSDSVYYSTDDLLKLQSYLISQTNQTREDLHLPRKDYPDARSIYNKSLTAYRQAGNHFPFLIYKTPSVKSSVFSRISNYLGFTGYYNPFTGEAQVNQTVPPFLLPEITLHEIAHQIGYAKEDEAEFVSFLVGTGSDDLFFRYSSWLNLLLYTSSQVNYLDSVRGDSALQELNPLVKADIRELITFNEEHRSLMEPVFKWVYGNYLMMNEQPQGMMSYDVVVSLVIDYYRKTGAL